MFQQWVTQHWALCICFGDYNNLCRLTKHRFWLMKYYSTVTSMYSLWGTKESIVLHHDELGFCLTSFGLFDLQFHWLLPMIATIDFESAEFGMSMTKKLKRQLKGKWKYFCSFLIKFEISVWLVNDILLFILKFITELNI